jgi:signal transduction histidine kinase
MRSNRFDRLAIGIILLVGIFLLEFFFPVGGVSYIIAAIYMLRFSGQRENVVVLGVLGSLAVIAGFLLSTGLLISADIPTFPIADITHGVLILCIIWIAVVVNFRFRNLIKKTEDKNAELIKSLTFQKDEILQRLQHISKDLKSQTEERNQIERELHKRKKLLDAMAHHFPDGVICVLNSEMKFVLADGGEMEELGLNKNGKKNENAFLNLAAIPELKKAFQGESVSSEITVNNKSYSLNSVPIPDSYNNINEILIVIRNITDQKRLENNLIKALEKEKELNVLKSQFVTMASHKFRTPLSTILSSVFLLENYTDADYELEKTAFFDKIKRSVHNLTALLNDYLSLGKLEEGKLKVTYTETDIKAFFDEFLQEIGSIKKVKQKIHFTYEGLECTIMTDKFLLKNILTNLLSNAIEYSPHDAEIQLSAELKKETLKIRVTDQGIGIPENEQHQIFKRFYRGQNANNVEGTGLGLNIAKKYIRLLKGTIEFTSQLNKGTTFIAIIPVMNVNVLEKQA